MSAIAPPLQRSPEVLLVAAAAGDALAWEQLVRAYTGRVYGLLVRQCNNRELAEELTQETFVKLVQCLRKRDEAGGYDEQGKFEPWLFRVAMNCLRDEMRRKSRQAQAMDMSPGAAASAGDGDTASAFAGVEASAAMRDQRNDPQERASTAEQVTLMQAAVAKMSEKERQILHLRHTAGLSFAEIAEALQEPLGTVLSSAHRALAKLKKDLAYLEA